MIPQIELARLLTRFGEIIMNSVDPIRKRPNCNFLALFDSYDRSTVSRLFWRVAGNSKSAEHAVERVLIHLALSWSNPAPGDNPVQAGNLYRDISANLEDAQGYIRDLLRNGRGWTAR